MNAFVCIAPDVKLGRDVKLSKFINLYGCEIGDETKSALLWKFRRMRPSAGAVRSPATPSFAKE